MAAAAALLAETEATRRGAEIASPIGYARSRAPALLADHRQAWTAILACEPDTTPAELANPAPASPVDGTLAAQRARIEANAARDLEAPPADPNLNLAGLAAAKAARAHDNGDRT